MLKLFKNFFKIVWYFLLNEICLAGVVNRIYLDRSSEKLIKLHKKKKCWMRLELKQTNGLRVCNWLACSARACVCRVRRHNVGAYLQDIANTRLVPRAVSVPKCALIAADPRCSNYHERSFLFHPSVCTGCEIGAHGWGWVEVLSQIWNNNLLRFITTYILLKAYDLPSSSTPNVNTIYFLDNTYFGYKEYGKWGFPGFLKDFCEISVLITVCMWISASASAVESRMLREHFLLLLSSRARTRSPFAAHSIRSGFCSMGSRMVCTHDASVAPSIGISGIRVRCNRLQNRSLRFLFVDWVQAAHVSS